MNCKCCKCDSEKFLPAVELLHDMPGLTKGAIFVYDKTDHEKGNIGYGTLRLAWDRNNCQQNWCGNAIGLPGQLVDNNEWFKQIHNDGRWT